MYNYSVSDALFGSSGSGGSGSFFSSSNISDLSMMKSGVYTKLMRSYVSQLQGSDESTTTTTTASTSKNTTSKSSSENLVSQKIKGLRETATVGESKLTKENKVLSNVKVAADSLQQAANDLANMDFDLSNKEDVYKAAKSFVNSYNSLLKKAGETANPSIEQSVAWMKEDMKKQVESLEKIGITIGKDSSLSIDEEKFMDANFSDMKAQLEGQGGLAGRTGMRASGLHNLAVNQIFANIGTTTYSSSGVLS